MIRYPKSRHRSRYSTTVASGLLAAFGLLASQGGCAPDDPVRVYESVPPTRELDAGFDSEEGEPKFRMIVAIGEVTGAMWFFKMTGTLEQIEAVEPAWNEFLQTVKFVDGEPQWTLPDDWMEAPSPSAMRFATLMTGKGDRAVEISVSSLPPGQPLVANVNRWRGQLGLRPIDGLQMHMALSTFPGDGTTFRVYDARGPRLETGMGGAPLARSMQPPGDEPETPFAEAAAGTPGDETAKPESIDFREPSGWTVGKRTSFVAGRWTHEANGEKAELSLLNMNPTDESWRLNVEAWARQIELSPEPDVAEITESITVAGRPARLARLEGSTDAVLVAMFEDTRGGGWVLKLAGSPKVVNEHRETFDSFLDGVQFRDETGGQK